MKIVNLKTYSSKDEVLSLLNNHELVNSRVKFDDKKGKPHFFVKAKNDTVKVKCQYENSNVKDGGFLEGTYFIGKLKEKNGISNLKGIIVTAPIYHTVLAIIMALFVYQCISLGGFNPVPVIMLVFSIFMFKNEFAKQGVIERYLHRVFKRLQETHTND